MSVLASMGFMISCGYLASKNGYDHRFNGKLTRRNGDIVFVSGNILTGNPYIFGKNLWNYHGKTGDPLIPINPLIPWRRWRVRSAAVAWPWRPTPTWRPGFSSGEGHSECGWRPDMDLRQNYMCIYGILLDCYNP